MLGLAFITFSFLIYGLLTRDNNYKPERTPTVYLDPCGRNTPEAEIFNPDRLRSHLKYFKEKSEGTGHICSEGGCQTKSEWMYQMLGVISRMGPGAYHDPKKCIEEATKEQL